MSRMSKAERCASRYLAQLLAALLLCTLAISSQTAAQGLRVMISGAFYSTYTEMTPVFEKKSGYRLITMRGSSMGTTSDAIPVRLQNGEEADVIIAARTALDDLAGKGFVRGDTEVDLARSPIGLAVRAGAPVPDISTVAALKKTLLRAKSIAYSDSASGIYVSSELFHRLGISDLVATKAQKIDATPVGEVVAAGKAEVGFQQMSELMAVPGITVVGPIPKEVQKITVFSAGVTTRAKSPAAAKLLIETLSTGEARSIMKRKGLEPPR